MVGTAYAGVAIEQNLDDIPVGPGMSIAGWDIGGPHGDVPGYPNTKYWSAYTNGVSIYGDDDDGQTRRELNRMKSIGGVQEFNAKRSEYDTYRAGGTPQSPAASAPKQGLLPGGTGKCVVICLPLPPILQRVPGEVLVP